MNSKNDVQQVLAVVIVSNQVSFVGLTKNDAIRNSTAERSSNTAGLVGISSLPHDANRSQYSRRRKHGSESTRSLDSTFDECFSDEV